MEKKSKWLSASRIKTLEDCSWTYWCKYHLKLPDTTNAGALRGTLCHAVFEWLLQDKHKGHYKMIIGADHITGSPAINRIVKAYLKKHALTNQEEYDCVNDMILVGLKNDFYVTGKKLFDPEYKFSIENNEPEYNAMGFIDKWAMDEDNKEIHVIDYKSSKSKFSGSELEANIQAMLYSVAAKKVHPDYIPIVTFVFLKFKKTPMQTVQFDQKTLEGFEMYLEDCQKKIDNFNYQDATHNFAADKKPKGSGFNGHLLCGFAKQPGQLKKDGTPMWHCPFKFNFNYYVLLDEQNKVVSSIKETPTHLATHSRDKAPTEFQNSLDENEGWRFERREYFGCPRWNKITKESF